MSLGVEKAVRSAGLCRSDLTHRKFPWRKHVWGEIGLLQSESTVQSTVGSKEVKGLAYGGLGMSKDRQCGGGRAVGFGSLFGSGCTGHVGYYIKFPKTQQ